MTAAAAIVAYGAISALGRGVDAICPGVVGERAPVAIARDAELARAGLRRPLAGRAPLDEGAEDRAAALLGLAVGDCIAQLDARWPPWRALRVGLVVGTSSGGMRTAARAFDALAAGRSLCAEDAGMSTYFGPLLAVAGRLGWRFAPASLVLGACASGALALGLATRWLAADACDLVLAGGFDALSVFVAAGFEALRATTAELPPRPFRLGRDGMSLGEGAAICALVRAGSGPAPLGVITGFGASCDAVHITAPDRTGNGLARAGRAALREAGLDAADVDLVSAHATATPFNGAAEAKALALCLGAHAREVAVHPFKAQIGHTLGAAGALETLACLRALERGLLPAAAGSGPLDPETPVRLLDVSIACEPRTALKLASAFGGANAALVLTGHAPSERAATPSRDAFVSRAAAVHEAPGLDALAALLGVAADRLVRTDALTRLALAAVAALQSRCGRLEGAGIVIGQAFATTETNARFAQRLTARGVLAAEPRRFPYTSPNAAVGECAIAFGLQGPAFAVGLGLHAGLEALVVAIEFVRAGDAERIVVAAVDDVGDTVDALYAAGPWGGACPRAGAIAALVSAAPMPRGARVRATALGLGPPQPALSTPPGHQALAPLAHDPPPEVLAAICPLGGSARVDFAQWAR